MMSPSVQFDIGEILWVDFPQRIPPGHEQLRQYPVIVIGISQLIQLGPYRLKLEYISWTLVTSLRKTQLWQN